MNKNQFKKEIVKQQEDDVANLEGIYWDTLINGVTYINSLGITGKNKTMILGDIIEILNDAQNNAKDPKEVLSGDIYTFIDMAKNSLGETTFISRFLNLVLNTLTVFTVIFILNGIMSVLGLGKFPKIESGMISLKVESFINPMIIILDIGLLKSRYIKAKIKYKKIIYLILVMITTLILSLIVSGVLEYFGFLEDCIEVSILNYILIVAGSVVLTYRLNKYMNEKN